MRSAAIGTALHETERALALLEPLLSGPDLAQYVSERLRGVAAEVLRLVKLVADVPRLEQGARAAVTRDFALLDEHLAGLASLDPGAYDKLEENEHGALSESLAAARRLVKDTQVQLPEIEPIEIGLHLELVVDRAITWSLALLRQPNATTGALGAAVARKLELLSDDECLRLWAKITAEVQPSVDPWSARIPLDPTVIDRTFFLLGGSDSLRSLISRYLVEIRPRLVRAAGRAGQASFPFPPAAIAQVLCWTGNQTTLSMREERLVSHIMLLSFLLAKRMGADRSDLCGLLGLTADARLLNGQSERTATKLVPDTATTLVVLSECKSALSLLAALASAAREPEIELLVRYKLAAEVGLPASRARFKGQREVALQRQLSAFLIEHGTFAVGTKFGPAETDLVAGNAFDPLVIEVKVFRNKPRPKAVHDAFVQACSYMDQAPLKSRGALVLFNLSDVPIVAPREFIARVAIVAINLAERTPSKRDEFIEVRAAERGQGLLEVLSVGGPTKRGSGLRPAGRRKSAS